jgi:hypothetical protein
MEEIPGFDFSSRPAGTILNLEAIKMAVLIYARLYKAFPKEIAEAALEIISNDIPFDRSKAFDLGQACGPFGNRLDSPVQQIQVVRNPILSDRRELDRCLINFPQ